MLILIPLLIVIGGYIGSRLHVPLSGMHPTVRLSEQIWRENENLTNETTLESRTFREMRQPTAQLYNEALAVRGNFYIGAWLFGGFFGLVLGIKLLMLSVGKRQRDFEPHRADCFSCGRCFRYCPKEHVRLRNKPLGIRLLDFLPLRRVSSKNTSRDTAHAARGE